METSTFDAAYDSICILNNTEGPSRNVFEPKFAARDQMAKLMETLRNVWRELPSLTCQAQFCRCLVFVGGNMIDTDEEKEGFSNLLLAYRLVHSTVEQNLVNIAEHKKEVDLKELLLEEHHPLIGADKDNTALRMEFAFEYLEVLNAICVHLANSDDTKFRLDDARKLLHRAEVAYVAWASWFAATSGESLVKLEDLHIGDDGKLVQPASTTPAEFQAMRLRHRMEGCHTTTIFLLSQVYGQKGDAPMASKYCYMTLCRQLQTKQEFSRKEWAKNAIILSAYFDSIRDFSKGLNCLRAGERLMPVEPADEDTAGVVAWGYARHYLNQLAYYASVASGEEALVTGASRADEWWCGFALQPQICLEQVNHVTSFDGAREVFKEGNKWFQLALQYYVIDGCCTDHIKLLQDISQLYKYLIVFETDVDRRIAMHLRRVEKLEKLPDELNFQSYATLVRQLLFDVGDVYTDVLELRILQKKSPEGKLGKPLSEAKLNQLTSHALSFFVRFCGTFKDLKSGKIPEVLDEDSRVPFFRCLMRIAHLQSKHWYKTPKEEYDGIAGSIERYNDALKFARANKLQSNNECAHEVRLAEEMVQLLPGKQRDVYRAFSKSS